MGGDEQMTHADILAQMLSEVTGRSLEQCVAMVRALQTCFPTLPLAQEVCPDEAERILAGLRLAQDVSHDEAVRILAALRPEPSGQLGDIDQRFLHGVASSWQPRPWLEGHRSPGLG
jgi:hypothetical protein